jgi:hypothetical protein
VHLSGAGVFAVGGAALISGLLRRFGRRLGVMSHQPRDA